MLNIHRYILFSTTTITQSIVKAIKHARNNNLTGPDNINIRLFKHLGLKAKQSVKHNYTTLYSILTGFLASGNLAK